MLDFSVEQFYLGVRSGNQIKGAHNQNARPIRKHIKTLLFVPCYADETTPFPCAEDMSSVITELQRIVNKVFKWFENNHMKTNPGKNHVLLSPNIQRVVPFCNVQIEKLIWNNL